jgi:hypothetical protein
VADRLVDAYNAGSELENKYKLMTFGIRNEAILRRAQLADTSLHYQYIEHRLGIDKEQDEKEAHDEAMSGFVAYPKTNDVLIGRGYPYRAFSGNTHWNTLVCEHLDKYLESNHRFVKSAIAMQVVKKIHEIGGRILQGTTDGWRILDDASAKEKAAIDLRTRAKSSSTSVTNTSKTTLSSRMDSPTMNKHASKRVQYDPCAV